MGSKVKHIKSLDSITVAFLEEVFCVSRYLTTETIKKLLEN